MRLSILLLTCLTLPLAAQRRAITFEDFIALKNVSDPQLSPDGKWVAYSVSVPSLQDNRGISRVWVAELATGRSRQLTGGPGSDRQPRWSPDGKTLAFISTREGGAQVWLLPVGGGDARKLSSLADGASDPIWLPNGAGLPGGVRNPAYGCCTQQWASSSGHLLPPWFDPGSCSGCAKSGAVQAVGLHPIRVNVK